MHEFERQATSAYALMTEQRVRGYTPSRVKALIGPHDSLDVSVPHPKRPRRRWWLSRICDAESTLQFATGKA